MHIVIMGCGRTGASLASAFEKRGHTVAIIDSVSDAFRRLPHDFQGDRITGVGFDRDTLRNAGVEDAYAFAAVSDGDNSNILAARVVRETFGVENVVARIADAGRADVYRRLGIATVAVVPWATSQIMGQLLPTGAEDAYTDSQTGVSLRRVALADAWAGMPYADAEAAAGVRLAYVDRFGEGIIPDGALLIQDGDAAYFACTRKNVGAAEKALAKPPTGTAAAPKKRSANRKATS